MTRPLHRVARSRGGGCRVVREVARHCRASAGPGRGGFKGSGRNYRESLRRFSIVVDLSGSRGSRRDWGRGLPRHHCRAAGRAHRPTSSRRAARTRGEPTPRTQGTPPQLQLERGELECRPRDAKSPLQREEPRGAGEGPRPPRCRLTSPSRKTGGGRGVALRRFCCQHQQTLEGVDSRRSYFRASFYAHRCGGNGAVVARFVLGLGL